MSSNMTKSMNDGQYDRFYGLVGRPLSKVYFAQQNAKVRERIYGKTWKTAMLLRVLPAFPHFQDAVERRKERADWSRLEPFFESLGSVVVTLPKGQRVFDL